MGYINLKVTERQLDAIINVTDTVSGMIGTGTDFDIENTKEIELIDKMLLKNKFKRNHN